MLKYCLKDTPTPASPVKLWLRLDENGNVSLDADDTPILWFNTEGVINLNRGPHIAPRLRLLGFSINGLPGGQYAGDMITVR